MWRLLASNIPCGTEVSPRRRASGKVERWKVKEVTKEVFRLEGSRRSEVLPCYHFITPVLSSWLQLKPGQAEGGLTK